MTKTSHANNNAQTQKPILAADTAQAMRELITISRSLLRMAQRESQALAQNDLMSLAILQDEKEVIGERYQQSSAEFRNRIEEFRGTDQAQLNQLDQLQKQVHENIKENSEIFIQIRDRARKTTENTLFSAQEIAQTHQVKMPGEIAVADAEAQTRSTSRTQTERG